ncbi:MAG TPA: prepilin-type N-terminal cleavage/methylation domain-containing protein [Myxococcota bacterium]|nr:prepilin-type N-terminal cleavage/methylation domain-containing protein [Myxococcota bacterium]
MAPKVSRGAGSEAGATLIELVVVIAISAILAGGVTAFMARSMTGFVDSRLRAALVDSADGALGRAKREVRLALPNSVRVSPDTRVLEILHIVDGARYRRAPGVNPGGADHSAATDWLSFTGADTQWNVLGRFAYLTFTYGSALAAGARLAVYPTSSAVWSEAAAGLSPASITPAGTTITLSDDGDEDAITLSSAFTFALESPRQRLYLVDGPITFLCDLTAKTLTRFSGYAPAAAQPTDPAAAPLLAASQALLASSVSTCQFRYDPGTATRAGLVSLALGLTQGTEQVSLLEQVHVENAP